MRLYKNILSGLDGIFSQSGKKKYLPGVAWFFVILILISIPGRNIPPTGSWFEILMVDKWVHAFLFGMLTYLSLRPLELERKKRAISVITILISLYAIGTELIQHYLVPGRSFDPWDWVADNVGIIIGLYINKKTPFTLK